LRLRIADFGASFLLAAIVVISPLIAGGFGVIGASIIEILAGLAALTFLAAPGGGSLRLTAVGTSLAILVLAAVLTIPHSQSAYQSIRYILLMLSCLLVFLTASSSLGRVGNWMPVAAGAALIGAVLSAMAMREYSTSGGGWRVFATFANPNYFSGFLVMTLPVGLALYVSSKERIITIILAAAVIFQAAALSLTAARFGIAAGAVGILAFIALGVVGRGLGTVELKRIALAAALSIPLLIVAARPVAERVGGAAASQAHSLPFRIYTWKAAAGMIYAHPVAGTGAGTFEIAFPRYAIAGYTRTAHNTFLQAGAEMGCIAPLALLAALFALAWILGAGAVRAGRSDEDGRSCGGRIWRGKARALILCGLFGGLMASSGRNLIDSDMYVPALAVVFWLLAGWGTALAQSAPRPDGRSRFGTISLGVLSIVLVGLTGVLLAGGVFAEAGDRAKSSSDMDSAYQAYDRAAAAVPFAADYHYELAKIDIECGEPGRALAELRRAASLEPTRSRYRYDISMVLASQGKLDAAIGEMNRAIELDPHSPRPRLALAGLYDASGDHKAALEAYRRLADDESAIFERLKGVPELVEPAYAIARYHLAMDAESRGDLRAAERHLRAAVERLERRRRAGQLLAAARMAGIVAPEDERSLHDLLISCHEKLAHLYARLGEQAGAEEHRKLAEKLRKEAPPGAQE